MTCGRTTYRRGILAAETRCRDCGWEYEGRNALGLAAQHHDRTGHLITSQYYYNRRHLRYTGGSRAGSQGGRSMTKRGCKGCGSTCGFVACRICEGFILCSKCEREQQGRTNHGTVSGRSHTTRPNIQDVDR